MSLQPDSRAPSRKREYKVAIDPCNARRKREETLVQIRKNKREDALFKKRRDINAASISEDTISLDDISPSMLSAMAQDLRSEDPNIQLNAARKLKLVLCIEHNRPVDEVIEAGVVPLMVQFLDRDDYPQLQLEAAWSLSNIAAGDTDQTQVIIDSGAVPKFVKLVTSPNESLREQAVWALGNVSGDKIAFRNFVLKENALPYILSQFDNKASLNMLRTATWTLSNLCRGKPEPPFEMLKLSLAVLNKLIHLDDHEILVDALWALSYLSDGENTKIQAVIDAGVCQRIVELLGHQHPSVVVPALRTAGNVVTGEDGQTQFIIEQGFLCSLFNILTMDLGREMKISSLSASSIRKEACWAVSNITAGNKKQIQSVMDSNLIKPVLYLLQDAEFIVRKEAAWAVCNITCRGSQEQIKYLVQSGCIKPICNMLECKDPNAIAICLEGLENILMAGALEEEDGVNIYAHFVEDVDGIEKLQGLLNHKNNEISERALYLLARFFNEDDQQDGDIRSVLDDIQLQGLANGFEFLV